MWMNQLLLLHMFKTRPKSKHTAIVSPSSNSIVRMTSASPPSQPASMTPVALTPTTPHTALNALWL